MSDGRGVARADAGIGVDRADVGRRASRALNGDTVRALIVALVLSIIGVAAKALIVGIPGVDPDYLLYFPGIALSSWYGGLWPGLLTTVVSGATDLALFRDTSAAPFVAGPAEQFRLLLFVLAGSITSTLTGLLRTARASAEAAREQLDATVHREEAARHVAESVAARLDVVRAVADALSRAVAPRDVAEAVLTAANQTLGMRAGAVAVASPSGDALLTVSTSGYGPDVLASTRLLPLETPVPVADAARNRTPLWFETEKELRDQYPILETFPDYQFDGSMAVLPLLVEERLVGAMWLRFAEPRTFTPDDRSFIGALSQQCAQALDRARLFEAEQQARTEAQAAEERLALLAEASAILGWSPEVEANLERVARLVADSSGDWIAIDLLDEAGALRAAALANRDPQREAAARAFRERFPPDLGDASHIARVLASGEPLIVPEIADEVLTARATTEDAASARRELGIRSMMLAPIGAGGATVGALTAGTADPERRYGEQDVAFLADLGRRVSSAIETARLYRQLDQFKGTVDASLDAVFMFDPVTLRFAYVNEGAVAQLGYERARLLEMRALDIEPNFDEDGYRDLIGSLTAGGQPSHTFTTIHRRSDGREIPVEVFLQAVKLPGGDAVMVANARDISERIEAQARLYRLARSERSRAAELNAVLQAMGEAILVCDSSGKVLLANQSAERLFETTPADYPELATRLESSQAPLPPLGVEGGPLEVHLAGANDRWLELTSYPVVLETPGQRPAGTTTSVATIMVMRDVTEVREALALREAFLGVLSHELRTPITTIYGIAKVLTKRSDSLDPETRAELIADIGAEADRLYRIVEDLVVLSRAETGIEVEGEPLLLRHLIPTVVASERQRWPATDFEIKVPDRFPTARGDATYVEQVLRNLLGNAAKYGPTQGTVSVVADASEDEVVVRVLDRGVGIQPDEVAHLFELFYRSPATVNRARGAGIGLWVCRRLVEGMGGRIWATPREGGGSEFGFSLRSFAETDIG
jgi:PAS domain S-box-containing protein